MLLACLLLLSGSLRADWINLTGAEIAPNIAEIYILEDRVEVKLEVYVDHISIFQDLVPDDWVRDLAADRPSLAERQRRFAASGLTIKTGNGEVLPARFGLVEPRTRVDRRSPFAGQVNPYNMRRLPDAPEDKRVLYAEISYPFSTRPDRLQISPPLDDSGLGRVNVGFIAYHDNVPVTDFRYLGRAETLDLDWQDPWYSRFENKNLTRHHRYPIMLFVYAEPRRVRTEAILRVADLERMLEFDRDEARDAEAMRDLLSAQWISYHLSQDLLTIDGRQAKPDTVRIDYLNAGLSGIRRVEGEVDLADPSLLVGVVTEYFVSGLPDLVEYEWRYFNERFENIPFTASDPVGPLANFIDPEAPVIRWQNFLKQYREPEPVPVQVPTGWNVDLPYVGNLRVWNRSPDAAQATAIVSGVLANLQAAFIEVQPGNLERRIDELTAAQDAEALGNELARLFAPTVRGDGKGAVFEFQDLQVEITRELDTANGFSATVAGTADIRAQHWGHQDQRIVQFQLLLDLVEPDGDWQLVDATVIDLKQVN